MEASVSDPQTAIINQPLLKLNDMAGLLKCSTRTVYRRRDAAQIPPSHKIGGNVYWQGDTVRKWFDAGCPASRN
jgi:predicted DNA-binding transcriptional regulator AlpA